jgi:hypothetical protein
VRTCGEDTFTGAATRAGAETTTTCDARAVDGEWFDDSRLVPPPVVGSLPTCATFSAAAAASSCAMRSNRALRRFVGDSDSLSNDRRRESVNTSSAGETTTGEVFVEIGGGTLPEGGTAIGAG